MHSLTQKPLGAVCSVACTQTCSCKLAQYCNWSSDATRATDHTLARCVVCITCGCMLFHASFVVINKIRQVLACLSTSLCCDVFMSTVSLYGQHVLMPDPFKIQRKHLCNLHGHYDYTCLFHGHSDHSSSFDGHHDHTSISHGHSDHSDSLDDQHEHTRIPHDHCAHSSSLHGHGCYVHACIPHCRCRDKCDHLYTDTYPCIVHVVG